ncbi:MAG: GntR family transcriptional regulator [Rhodospirillales bacterium]|nr:GntR family transcriptional regulator [Rhodospirillales bacterium]
MPNSLTHRTLSAAIADRLREAILGGAHRTGTQLRQDALAADFGVSRIPVREALFQLEAEGLVQIEPHKGAVVTGLSMAEVDDVFYLRALLEGRLLADSIPRLTDSDFADIDGARDAFDRMVATGDIAHAGGLNAELHMAFYAGARLPKTTAIVAGLLQTSDRYTRLQLSSTKGLVKAGREHRELAALCRKRDVPAAMALLVAHIEAVRTDLLGVLKRTPELLADDRVSRGSRPKR